MSTVGFFPGMRWTDGQGFLTPDAQRLLLTLVASNNGEGAGVTVDGQQTLINKTISGDWNTIEDIGTNSLKSRTGEDNTVVTGTPGANGTVAVWDVNGDIVDGPLADELVTQDQGDERYVMAGGQLPTILPAIAVADIPDAADYLAGLIYVTDESGGATVAFSDGTNWRRVQDRVVVS